MKTSRDVTSRMKLLQKIRASKKERLTAAVELLTEETNDDDDVL